MHCTGRRSSFSIRPRIHTPVMARKCCDVIRPCFGQLIAPSGGGRNSEYPEYDISDVPLKFGDPCKPLQLVINVLDEEFWHGDHLLGCNCFTLL